MGIGEHTCYPIKTAIDKFITKITELGDFRGKKKLFASIKSALLKAHQTVIVIVDKVPSVSILI